MRISSWKNLLLTASLSVLPACGAESLNTAREPEQTEGFSLKTSEGKFLRSSDAIPGQYIVVLRDADVSAARVPEVAQALATRHGATVTRTYSHALRGFAMKASEAAAYALSANPQVDYVEEDGRVHATATQSNATWGLDRIDQVSRPLNGTYSYGATGSGVHAYIIDSGIMSNHPDFGGRATGAFTAINDGWGTGDCNGHGTHVAGTVGSSIWGVAKRVSLHSVRVLGCDNTGSDSQVIAGVDWVTANHVKPAVANMSIGGSPSQAKIDAVRNSIAQGITYVVAAGNSGTDACTSWPANVAEALTVGATDSSDNRASLTNWSSNYGSCLDLFAPGVNITSTYNNGGSTMMSGTSMAAPHVAGVAALYLESNRGASPATVSTALITSAPNDKVGNAGSGSPNRMLYSNPPPSSCGLLTGGQALTPGQTLRSCNGNARLIHQNDGNVVVYDRLGALWATNTYGQTTSTFVMQTDGNLVLYPGSGTPLWASLSYGYFGAYMRMQDDCNLVVYSAQHVPVWASNTSCR